MKDYPEIWVREVMAWLISSEKLAPLPGSVEQVPTDIYYMNRAKKVLRALDDHGALKSPPEPRELWHCEVCDRVLEKGGKHYHSDPNIHWCSNVDTTRYIEVLDE